MFRLSSTTVSDPYPCVSCFTFKGGRYFKVIHVFRDVIEHTGIRSAINNRLLIEHHTESNLPVEEYTALRYWIRSRVQGPCPKRIKHLFNGVL